MMYTFKILRTIVYVIGLYGVMISTGCSVIGLIHGLDQDSEAKQSIRRNPDQLGNLRFGARVAITSGRLVEYEGEYWGRVPMEAEAEEFANYKLAQLDSIRESLPKKGELVEVTLSGGTKQTCIYQGISTEFVYLSNLGQKEVWLEPFERFVRITDSHSRSLDKRAFARISGENLEQSELGILLRRDSQSILIPLDNVFMIMEKPRSNKAAKGFFTGLLLDAAIIGVISSLGQEGGSILD